MQRQGHWQITPKEVSITAPSSGAVKPAKSRGHPIAATYRDAGVDVAAGNALVEAIKPLAQSTARPGTTAALGGFGGLFDLKKAGFRDPILVAATDGAGTKLKLAIALANHETIGIDLVAMSVNDLVVQGAEPLFFLDYFASGRLEPVVGKAVVAGIAEGCRRAGCALIGGETAEMPGLYQGDDYDLAGFAVGAVERGQVLPTTDPPVAHGDVILGIASDGLHANGFSLVRRLIADHELDLTAPAPFAPGTTLGAALLAPTRIYVRPCLTAIHAGGVKALAHITGGGLTENIPRILPEGTTAALDLANWPITPVFLWLAQLGAIAAEEMLRTFNCGIGMAAITAPDDADRVAGALVEAGETVHVIGAVVPHADTALSIANRDAPWSDAGSAS